MKLKSRKGPLKVGCVGGISTNSPYGIFSFKLPLYKGLQAVMS